MKGTIIVYKKSVNDAKQIIHKLKNQDIKYYVKGYTIYEHSYILNCGINE